jgi:hypothetical protein
MHYNKQIRIKISTSNLENCEKTTGKYSTEDQTLSVNINDNIIKGHKLKQTAEILYF